MVDYSVFKEKISSSPLLEPAAGPLAWLLPGIELVVVVLLIIPRWRLRGLYMSFLLMILFTGYIIATAGSDEYLPCSCGGVLEKLSWKAHLLFNGIFIALALSGIQLERNINRKSKILLNSLLA